MKKNKPIRVWSFEDAPKRYQNMSEHGGDEDWLAIVPNAYVSSMYLDGLPNWMTEGSPFGCCAVSKRKLKDGYWLVIGAHS